jgi:hypothetical protein
MTCHERGRYISGWGGGDIISWSKYTPTMLHSQGIGTAEFNGRKVLLFFFFRKMAFLSIGTVYLYGYPAKIIFSILCPPSI